MKKTHAIITRFNIKINVMKTNYLEKIDITNDNNYLDERFRLFENYTVPSIKKQTNKNFIWIVLFSNKTPLQYKNRIQKIEQEVDQFIPIFLSDKDDSYTIINNELLKRKSDIYITTRVDNDDALSINYIEDINKNIQNINIEKVNKTVIIYNNGCQYDESHSILSNYHFPNNHFSTMISKKSKKIDIITNYDHMEIKNSVNKILEIENTQPMWLEVVHKTNVSNRTHIKFNSLIFNKEKFQLFGISERNINKKINTILYVIMQKPLTFFRLIKQYNIKKIIKKIKKKVTKK